MYTKITESISITVIPEPIVDQSRPKDSVFAHSYTITIENLGTQSVQLVERHWVITSGGRHFDEVIGEGVVGLQPVLESGQKFEYSSGAVIEDPVGAMSGTYTMRKLLPPGASEEYFEVEIPEFPLNYMEMIH